MKKNLLSALCVGTMALILSAMFAVPSFATCPAKEPCNKAEKTAPVQEFKKPMTPEERAQFREAKKAEFEERLNLTESQKAQLEKIKADEKKALAPYREKIKKEQKKMEELFAKEREIRKNSMQKFEATLTPEQKAELQKIKDETKAEMDKMPMMFPPKGPHHGAMMPPKGPFDKPACPPDCECSCHNPGQAEPADCKCPCHNQDKTSAPEKESAEK